MEPFFSELELEPVFVKNLESVQGGERDTLYFSITARDRDKLREQVLRGLPLRFWPAGIAPHA